MDVRGRMGTRYEDYLSRHAQEDDPGEELTGHSGYFTAPTAGFDPRIFEAGTDHIKPAVRRIILKLLYDFWESRYTSPLLWSTVWIAGSGLSHQWGADRGGVGDLDILIGVDHPKFLEHNHEFGGLPEALIDQHFNKEFYGELQPNTTEYSFGAGQDPFEITYYVNPGATDIRNINPYAAYNLTDDTWTVCPPELPADWDPFTYFPQDWWETAREKVNEAQHLIERYRSVTASVAALEPGSPRWVNATTQLKRVTEEAVELFESIHGARKQAFSTAGKGFYGPENAMWQYGKLTGVIDALRTVKGAHDAAKREAHKALYGDASLGTNEAVVSASLAATKYRVS